MRDRLPRRARGSTQPASSWTPSWTLSSGRADSRGAPCSASRSRGRLLAAGAVAAAGAPGLVRRRLFRRSRRAEAGAEPFLCPGTAGDSAERTLHVDDEPADEQGARAVGMRFAAAPLSSVEALAADDSSRGWRSSAPSSPSRTRVGRRRACRGRLPVRHRRRGAQLYAIVLAIVLWITCGHPCSSEHLARGARRSNRRSPSSSPSTSFQGSPSVPRPGEEQGLTGLHGNRLRQRYAANFVVIADVTPIVEELMFRGAGAARRSARSSPFWSPA